jgi:hypothetical protein
MIEFAGFESKLTWRLSVSSPALVGTQSKLWFADSQKNPTITVGRIQAILASYNEISILLIFSLLREVAR